MKRISFVNGSGKYEGTYTSSRRLYSELSSLGFQTSWYQCLDSALDSVYNIGDIPIRGFHLLNKTISMGLNRLFIYPRKLSKIQNEDDQVIFSDPTLLAGVELNSRTSVIIHDLRPLSKYSDKLSTHLMYQYLLPKLLKVQKLIVPTNYVKEQLMEMGFLASKIYVIPWTSRFENAYEAHASLSYNRILSQRKLNLVYIASDRDYKNIKFYISLATKLGGLECGINFNFVLVSKLKQGTFRYLRRLGPKNFTVMSDVSDIEKIYMDSDVLVYPSLFEGFGLPLVEAMSMGMPIIANDIEPFREIVSSGGILIPAKDMDSWVESILSFGNINTYSTASSASISRYDFFSSKSFKETVWKVFREMS